MTLDKQSICVSLYFLCLFVCSFCDGEESIELLMHSIIHAIQNASTAERFV